MTWVRGYWESRHNCCLHYVLKALVRGVQLLNWISHSRCVCGFLFILPWCGGDVTPFHLWRRAAIMDCKLASLFILADNCERHNARILKALIRARAEQKHQQREIKVVFINVSAQVLTKKKYFHQTWSMKLQKLLKSHQGAEPHVIFLIKKFDVWKF